MREFLQETIHALEAAAPVELVSVLTASGSTPRGAGAMMAVFPNGKISGTIGGGNVEYTAQKLAGKLLHDGEDALRAFRFVQGDAASLGMVCGGDVQVHFQYLSPQNAKMLAVLRDLMEASGKNANSWLVRKIEGERVTAVGAAGRDGVRHMTAPLCLSALLKDQAVFCDGYFAVPVVKAGRVYIFGGGHVARALVPVLSSVGFRPVVYDDRSEFVTPELFPTAEAVVLGDFAAIDTHLRLTADDYVVVMTRGHQADYTVLTQVLRSGAKYLGCIGSRRKLAFCRERLIEAGFTEAEYARLHAPIGLSIGAETPEEIAISVAAELIAVRAEKA